MAETTRIRKTRIEEKTTIEISGDDLVALITRSPELALDSRYPVEVDVVDGGYNEFELDEHVTVRITQTIVSRDDTETLGAVTPDPTDLAQQQGVGLGVRPPGVRRQPRRSLPASGDEDLGQNKD